MKKILLPLVLFFPLHVFAQLWEPFNGPEVTSAWPWQGDTTKFFVTADKELRSNGHSAGGEARIYIGPVFWNSNEWRFTLRTEEPASSRNYFRIYLWSEKPDMNNSGEALFVRVGYADKNIALCYRSGLEAPLILFTGRQLPKPPLPVEIKVVTDAKGNAVLYSKFPSDTDYYKEGAFQWPISDQPGYFMAGVVYTAERGREKYVDNIYIHRYQEENPPPQEPQGPTPEPSDPGQPPAVVSIEEVDPYLMHVTFDAPVAAQEAVFYLSELGQADEIYQSDDNLIVAPAWFTARQKGRPYTLSFSGIYNAGGDEYKEEYNFVSARGESTDGPPENSGNGVVINEVMADPNGLTALPKTEYVELYNASGRTVSLAGWTFYYADRAVALTSIDLPHQGCVVLYRTGREIKIDQGGLAMPLAGFPSLLANMGKDLRLTNSAGQTVDEIAYHQATAGVSWERNGKDWVLSSDPRGGSPGSRNASGTPAPSDPLGTGVVESGEIVFNEILPDPFLGGSEYIELYNRSDRDLSLAGLSIATRKDDGSLSTRYPLSTLTGTFGSGQYVLLTKAKSGVADFYLLSNPAAVHELRLPVLVNTSATLILFRTKDEKVIDQLSYSSHWHSDLIREEKGVALERIDPDGSTSDPDNWTSAAQVAGYGTPGYRNSQYQANGIGINSIEDPKYAEQEGLYSILYHLDRPGYSCRAYIFNLSGARVAEISHNELLGTDGAFVWDGKTPAGTPLSAGPYIFYIELYHESGRLQTYKKVFLVR